MVIQSAFRCLKGTFINTFPIPVTFIKTEKNIKMLTSQVNIEKIDTINFFSYLSTATSQQTDTEEIGVQFVNLKSANNL